MGRIFAIFLFLNFSLPLAKAQPGAAFCLESPFLTGFQKACTDLEGNLYVSGYFQRQLTLGGTSFWADRGAYFLAKYRPDFTLVWARQLTAPPRDLAWSGAQLLVLGQFQQALYLDKDTLRSAGGFDAFVAALDAETGQYRWYRHLSATRDVLAQALSTDPEGNIYLTGGFEGNFSLGGHSLERDLFKNAYLIKLNAQGLCQWATRLSGGHNPLTGVFVRSLAFDAQGFLWLGGNLCGAGRFDQKMIYSSTEQYFAEGRVYNHDIFVACYQPDGILRWVKTLAQNADLQVLLPDHQGHLYLAGHFQGSTNLNRPQQLGMAKFGRQSLKAALGASQHPVEDSFLAKINALGHYEWLKHGQGTANNRAIALAYDASQGQVWLGGMFQQSLSLAESNWQAEAGPHHQQDLYWIGLDSKGTLRAGGQFGGPGNDQLTALLMAPGPVLYLIGRQVRADGTANGFILNGQKASEARPEAQKP